MKPVSPLCSLTLGGIVALAPACGPLPDDAPVMAQAAALHENQGTELAGTNRAGYAVLYSGARDAAGGAFSSLTVYRGALQAKQGGKVYSGDSAKLIGARLTAVDGSYVEIVRACPHPRTPQGWKPPSGWVPPTGCTYPVDWTVQPDEFEYELQVVSGGTRTPLCKGDWNRAVPMVGTFDKTGMRLTSATSFTFACNGGTAVKCSNWGYKPWVDPDRHLACTRMARADYCGDGASHTFEGTPVDVYDPAGILYPVTSAAYFEAAWTTKGALCLSKLRWQTLPPDGYCGAVLPDPRNGSGRFCDDISSDEMVRLGARVYNNSGEYERGLNNWILGADRMLSSAGFYGGVTPTTPPEAGYTQLQFEGIAFATYLTGTTLLRTYRNPLTGDSLTTAGTPASQYTQLVRDEGYVYPVGGALPPTAVPLSLYSNGVDYLSSTKAPPAGYQLVRRDSYLPVRP